VLVKRIYNLFSSNVDKKNRTFYLSHRHKSIMVADEFGYGYRPITATECNYYLSGWAVWADYVEDNDGVQCHISKDKPVLRLIWNNKVIDYDHYRIRTNANA
jgi:hypothetical protein